MNGGSIFRVLLQKNTGTSTPPWLLTMEASNPAQSVK
jgi:hypothetical protein